jgi:hypothetical protein
MGIPLAALAIQPPPNPIDSIQKGVALKSLLQNQQFQAQAQPLELQQRQQALVQQQQENQQRALAIKDDQTMRDLSTKYVQKDSEGKVNGYDFNGFLNDARSQGVSPARLNQMGAQQAQYSETLMKMSDQQRTQEQNKNKALYETVEGIRKLPEAQRGAALAASLPSLQKQGVDISSLSQASKFDDASLDAFEATLGMHTQMLSDAEKSAQTEKAAADAAKARMEVQQGGNAEQQKISDFVKKTGKSPSEYPAWEAAQKAAATLPIDINKAVATEVAKQKALAPELDQISNTTMAGRKYISREDIPKGSEGVTERQANQAGIPVVDKDVAGTLSEIDTAKANQQAMLNLVKNKLATSPGERIYKGPENKLEAAMQTDPTLASMGTFRNAAIQTMRAVAGSKGLRINQYEVQMAIDNDIPKMTDTWEVAQAKISALQKFLDNAESAHLVRNRAASAGAPKAAAAKDPLGILQ